MDTVTVQDAAQSVILSLDTTAYHNFRLEVKPGVGYRFFVDDSFVAEGPPVTDTVNTNQLYIGDGTSGGNAKADVTFYRFTEGYSVCLLYDSTKPMKSGSTLPIKLQLCDGSGNNLSSASVTLHAVRVTQISTSTSSVVQDSGNANPDNDFRFDSSIGSTGGHIFNLSTKGLPTGTYNLNFSVAGGSAIYVAPFQVR